MEHEPVRSDAESVLSEDAAHRLLARAVELDAHRASNVSLSQLREIAREAGISSEAFDEALGELRVASDAAAKPASRRLFRAVTTDVVAFALFTLAAGVFRSFR